MRARALVVICLCLAALIDQATAAPVSRSAVGANAAAIQAAVDQFRADLGTLNANVVGSLPSGRREINWDGVPDEFAAPSSIRDVSA